MRLFSIATKYNLRQDETRGIIAIKVGETHYRHGERQVFAINNSRDMLVKLHWEINELRRETGYPRWNSVAYRAFNCAITAWSLIDWLWEEMSDPTRATFGGDKGKGKFQKACMTNSSALEICESLANSGKHRKRLPGKFNANIKAKTIAEMIPMRAGDPVGEPINKWKWETIILYYDNEEKALDVFQRAHADLEDLINRYSTCPNST